MAEGRKNSIPPYKKLKAENYDITKFLFPPDTHSKYVTSKANFEAFSRSLRVQLVKDTTISSSKAPKSHVKIVKHMHYDNIFKPLITVVFYMSRKLGLLGLKAQDLVILFRLGEEEPLSDIHIRDLAIISELVLMIYQTGHINNFTGKYIMELSNLKHLQCYMTSFYIGVRLLERQPQKYQLSIIFTTPMEIILETLETLYIDMNPSHSMIEPIVNNNFGNKLKH